jgi:hypothetical protein
MHLESIQKKLSTKGKNQFNEYLTNRSLTGSKADVASSNKRIVGFRTIARAIHTRCFCPPIQLKTIE